MSNKVDLSQETVDNKCKLKCTINFNRGWVLKITVNFEQGERGTG